MITIAIPLSIIIGSILDELFFIFIFVFFIFVGYIQYQNLKYMTDWANSWFKQTAIGFFIGSVISLIQIFALLKLTDLITNHLISLFIITFTTVYFQFKVLRKHIENEKLGSIWFTGHLLSVTVFLSIVSVINFYYNLKFSLLVIAVVDYQEVVPWAITGSIFGLTYSTMTAILLNKWIN